MEAVIITKFGGPEVLEIQKVPKPDPVQGEVLIQVKAFGLNHAEMHMRKGEWDEWNPISGLECVGIVAACPGEEFPVGKKVVAVMGGMGRNRPGGYADFVNVPVSNVVLVESNLEWEQLAAIPEVYSTAYSCISTILNVQKGDSVLICGATSTIGQAAVHLAVAIGAKVTATTRRQQRFDALRAMGVFDTRIEQKQLYDQFAPEDRFEKVLNLVGNSVLLESIALTRTGGRILQAGWLGGLNPLPDFNPMIQMESGVHFSLFHSKVLGTPQFPMSGIPLQQIITNIENKAWSAEPAYIFQKADIVRAHELLDSGLAGGKIVVRV